MKKLLKRNCGCSGNIVKFGGVVGVDNVVLVSDVMFWRSRN